MGVLFFIFIMDQFPKLKIEMANQFPTKSLEDSIMKNNFKKIIFIPVWFLTNIFKPFLKKDHPFKNKKFSLQLWVDNGTPFCFYYSIFMWFVFVLDIMLVYLYLKK